MTRARAALVIAAVPVALVAALLTGCSASSSAGSSSLPSSTATDGATLVKELCSRCHPFARVEAAKKDRSGWDGTVTRMQTHGQNASVRVRIQPYVIGWIAAVHDALAV